MKNLIIILSVLLLFVSCQKEEPTTYQVINNTTRINSSVPFLDGSLYEVVVFLYSGSDIIDEDHIESIEPGGGKSDIIEVHEGCEKVKISFKLLPPESEFYDTEENSRIYTVSFTLITKEKNNEVIIDDNTMISSNLGVSKIKQLFTVQ